MAKRRSKFKSCLIMLGSGVIGVILLIVNMYYGIIFVFPANKPMMWQASTSYEQDDINKKFKRVSGIDFVAFLEDKGITPFTGGRTERQASLLHVALSPKTTRYYFVFSNIMLDTNHISFVFFLRNKGTKFFGNLGGGYGLKTFCTLESDTNYIRFGSSTPGLEQLGNELCAELMKLLEA